MCSTSVLSSSQNTHHCLCSSPCHQVYRGQCHAQTASATTRYVNCFRLRRCFFPHSDQFRYASLTKTVRSREAWCFRRLLQHAAPWHFHDRHNVSRIFASTGLNSNSVSCSRVAAIHPRLTQTANHGQFSQCTGRELTHDQ